MDFLTRILLEKEKEIENLTAVQTIKTKVRPSFYRIVKEEPEKIHVIGEIKRASPSKGVINEHVDILQQARSYEAAGVSAISVLTDPVFLRVRSMILPRLPKWWTFLFCVKTSL